MNGEEMYKFIFEYYYGLYIDKGYRILDYNPKLTRESNACRRANIIAVKQTEINYRDQFKEMK